MKSQIIALLKAILRLAQSESGELLSVRRKAHLLHAEVYSRMAAAAEPRNARPVVVPPSATRRPAEHRSIRHRSVAA